MEEVLDAIAFTLIQCLGLVQDVGDSVFGGFNVGSNDTESLNINGTCRDDDLTNRENL